MAVAKTMSAQSMSALVRLRTFKSTSRRSHESGNNAETVSKPNGGKAQRLPSKGNAWRKLQYVSGNSGLINKTFTIPLLRYAKYKPLRRKNLSVIVSDAPAFTESIVRG